MPERAHPLISSSSYEALVLPGAAFLATCNRMPTKAPSQHLALGETSAYALGDHTPPQQRTSATSLPVRPLELTVTEQGRWCQGRGLWSQSHLSSSPSNPGRSQNTSFLSKRAEGNSLCVGEE